ncbi:MAG: D-sedoheptulose 7-phosphate isomerase [Leptospiraceae bacterium]|nr:D-sedoheptulose 7-phosphate isomerase [Leptospiraceae bacterium]MDW7974921.1 D-sedoheptulose 7-phosphate isomerase [Leptospiraceae bacterium]
MEKSIDYVRKRIKNSLSVKEEIYQDEKILHTIWEVSQAIVGCFKQGGKVLLCGNGGSAADAQHIAAELSGRFYLDREPLFAEALHVNTSYLTAVANDYSFEEVYSRLVKAKGKTGDVLIGISTSGNSKNVINAIQTANELGMITIGLTGRTGGKMANLCKYVLKVPSEDTPTIQEAHIMIGHIVCDLVEKALFQND